MRQEVLLGRNVSVGQSGPVPEHNSATSQAPALGRQEPVVRRSLGHSMLVPSQTSSTSQSPRQARHTKPDARPRHGPSGTQPVLGSAPVPAGSHMPAAHDASSAVWVQSPTLHPSTVQSIPSSHCEAPLHPASIIPASGKPASPTAASGIPASVVTGMGAQPDSGSQYSPTAHAPSSETRRHTPAAQIGVTQAILLSQSVSTRQSGSMVGQLGPPGSSHAGSTQRPPRHSESVMLPAGTAALLTLP